MSSRTYVGLGYRRRGPNAAIGWTILAALALAGGSCTPPIAPATRPTSGPAEDAPRGVIIGFEGLQPFSGFSAYSLVKEVGESCQLTYAAGSGGYFTFMPLVRQAHDRGTPVYIVGYSLGGDQARRLAVECQKEKIPVRILFLLDPHYTTAPVPALVPSNVLRVVFYMSSAYRPAGHKVPTPAFLEDAAQTTLSAEDCRAVWHTGLPGYVTPRVRIEVAADVEVPNLPTSMPMPPDMDAPPETEPAP
ncbi:MAG: hypothetical protein NT031_15405, partial [Planctomycetota bacterium]|nr:hypothetical protein [Planctomycetota bacterium]